MIDIFEVILISMIFGNKIWRINCADESCGKYKLRVTRSWKKLMGWSWVGRESAKTPLTKDFIK